ncbi:MAG: sigma factor-like helix-turn-helix DNA-binding protein [Candidatus Paceibacterota bacterium]
MINTYKKKLESLLSVLPQRNIEILKKRFGLNNQSPQTLEEIGKNYKITRERIRQIINASLNNLKKTNFLENFKEFYEKAEEILKEHGGYLEKENFINLLLENKEFKGLTSNEAFFLLTLNDKFLFEGENQLVNSYFYLSTLKKKEILKRIQLLEQLFKKEKKPLNLDEVYVLAKNKIDKNILRKELFSLATISKKILMNPFGEVGLKNWREINPVGSNDRAYVLLGHLNRPLHFKELAKMLENYKDYPFPPKLESRFWKKRVCVQTVHNELIKDKRFVLVGRGIYALEKWGYQKNNIKEIIKHILFFAQKPLDLDTILEEVKKRKIAKERTILLNLSDKKTFKKFPDNTYFLTEQVFKKLLKNPPRKPEENFPYLLEG